MDKEMIQVYLRQGEGEHECYMGIKLEPEIIERMNQIRAKDVKLWEHRDVELMVKAIEQLRADGVSV